MGGNPLLFQQSLGVVLVDETAVGSPASKVISGHCEKALALAKAARLPVADLRACNGDGEAFIANEALMKKIDVMARHSFLICGGLLEGAVTHISIKALLDGFDVFVPAELVHTGEPERVDLFYERIRKAVGSIVTFRQVVLELLSREEDDYLRAPLLGLLED